MRTYDWETNLPSFFFKELNSFSDMDCFIEEELPQYQATKIIESIKIPGKSGRLHQTYGDYDSFDYPIEMQLTKFDQIEEVKNWLTGEGQLIINSDTGFYRNAIVIDKGTPRPYANQMNAFWKFTVTFECEPFRRQIGDPKNKIKEGNFIFTNSGMEASYPKFYLNSKGGDVTISVNNRLFVLKGTTAGELLVDSERKIAVQNSRFIQNVGEWPYAEVGENSWQFKSINESMYEARSVWL